MYLLPKQHLWLFDTKHFYKAFIGGQGSGKTLIGVMWAIAMSRINKNCVGVIVSPTFKMSHRIIQRTLLEILNGKHQISPYRIRHERLKSEESIRFPQWNSEIWFSNAANPDTLRGPNVAWALLDEAGIMAYECYLEIEARVRDPKAKLLQIGVTTTPGDYKWLEKEFPPSSSDLKLFVRASTRENTFLRKEYSKNAETKYDSKRQQRYLEGAYIDLYKDSIYYCFSKEKNIIKKYEPKYNLPIYISCDFNRNPCVWLLFQIVDGKMIFFDQVVMDAARTELMIRELGTKILDARGNLKYFGLIVYGDSTSLSLRSTAATYSDFELIDRAFERHPNYENRVYHNPLVKERVPTVNKELENGNIQFVETLVDCIEDVQGAMWSINKYDKDEGRGKDKSAKRATHWTDCVDYPAYAIYKKDDDSAVYY